MFLQCCGSDPGEKGNSCSPLVLAPLLEPWLTGGHLFQALHGKTLYSLIYHMVVRTCCIVFLGTSTWTPDRERLTRHKIGSDGLANYVYTIHVCPQHASCKRTVKRK